MNIQRNKHLVLCRCESNTSTLFKNVDALIKYNTGGEEF